MTTGIDRQPSAVAVLPPADAADPRPLVPYIGRGEDGEPALIGSRCGACGEIHIGPRSVCLRCGARDGLASVTLSRRGTLYNYTTVHRCLSGVPVPFVFAIVDLEGGGTVKGNLVADGDIAYDMPVRLVFDVAAQKDAQGRSYLTYHFVSA